MAIHASNNPFSCTEGTPGGGAAVWGGITGDIENQEDLIALLGSLNTPSTLEKQFGAGAVLITAGANTTIQEVCNHINSIGFTVTAGQMIKLCLTVKRTISGQAWWYHNKYFFKRNNLVGSWGTGSTNGEIVPSDLLLYFEKIAVGFTPGANNILIELGSIGTTPIHTYLQNYDGDDLPELTDNIMADNGSIYYFDCVANGINVTYKYKGTLPKTIGLSTFDAGDFEVSGSSGSGETAPPNPTEIIRAVVTLQDEDIVQTTEQYVYTATEAAEIVSSIITVVDAPTGQEIKAILRKNGVDIGTGSMAIDVEDTISNVVTYSSESVAVRDVISVYIDQAGSTNAGKQLLLKLTIKHL